MFEKKITAPEEKYFENEQFNTKQTYLLLGRNSVVLYGVQSLPSVFFVEFIYVSKLFR